MLMNIFDKGYKLYHDNFTEAICSTLTTVRLSGALEVRVECGLIDLKTR